MLPLEGIKIIDLTRQHPGPFCSMVLGDLGADVLRVNEPASSVGGRRVAALDSRDATTGYEATVQERLARLGSLRIMTSHVWLNGLSAEGKRLATAKE